MPDLETAAAMVRQIDANVAALMDDGKLATAKYAAGAGGPSADRAAAVDALLRARAVYQDLLDRRGLWSTAVHDDRPRPEHE